MPLVLLLGITVQSESTLHWKLGTSDFGLWHHICAVCTSDAREIAARSMGQPEGTIRARAK